jgi:hypothetical protein
MESLSLRAISLKIAQLYVYNGIPADKPVFYAALSGIGSVNIKEVS